MQSSRWKGMIKIRAASVKNRKQTAKNNKNQNFVF